jgi:hypothetical protein
VRVKACRRAAAAVPAVGLLPDGLFDTLYHAALEALGLLDAYRDVAAECRRLEAMTQILYDSRIVCCARRVIEAPEPIQHIYGRGAHLVLMVVNAELPEFKPRTGIEEALAAALEKRGLDLRSYDPSLGCVRAREGDIAIRLGRRGSAVTYLVVATPPGQPPAARAMSSTVASRPPLLSRMRSETTGSASTR